MLHLAFDHIVKSLNGYVDLRTGVDDRVVQGYLMEQDGNENNDARDRVVLSLVNLEEDRMARSPDLYQKAPDDDRYQRVRPEVAVNVYLLFTANLRDYKEALKSLSYVVSFFQAKNYFDYAEIDGLEGETGRLVFELFSLTFEQVNHLWGALGAKYMPSVVYRMRVAGIRDAQVEALLPPVSEVATTEA